MSRNGYINNIETEYRNVKVSDAILESTAAPTYFPSYNDHVDGGMGMNDPSLAALVTAFQHGRHPLDDFRLLSIGTGYTNRYVEDNEKWGVIDWIWKGSKHSGHLPLVDLLLDVQQQIPSQFCQQLLGNHYLKINFALPEAIPLDAYNSISDLIEDADAYVHDDSAVWHRHIQWARDHLL